MYGGGSDAVSVAYSCPLGLAYVLIVFSLFVNLFISHFGFKSGILLLIALIPVHCFSITFSNIHKLY